MGIIELSQVKRATVDPLVDWKHRKEWVDVSAHARDRIMSLSMSTTNYVGSTSQLILEIYVRDLRASLSFWLKLGFQHEIPSDGHVDPTFAILRYEESFIFLEQISAGSPVRLPSIQNVDVGNVRVVGHVSIQGFACFARHR